MQCIRVSHAVCSHQITELKYEQVIARDRGMRALVYLTGGSQGIMRREGKEKKNQEHNATSSSITEIMIWGDSKPPGHLDRSLTWMRIATSQMGRGKPGGAPSWFSLCIRPGSEGLCALVTRGRGALGERKMVIRPEARVWTVLYNLSRYQVRQLHPGHLQPPGRLQ